MGEFGEKMAVIPHMLKLLLERGTLEKNYPPTKAQPEALPGSNLEPTPCTVPRSKEVVHQMLVSRAIGPPTGLGRPLRKRNMEEAMEETGKFLSHPGQRFASERPPPILGRPPEIRPRPLAEEYRKTISLSETNDYQREPSTRVPLVWEDIATGPI